MAKEIKSQNKRCDLVSSENNRRNTSAEQVQRNHHQTTQEEGRADDLLNSTLDKRSQESNRDEINQHEEVMILDQRNESNYQITNPLLEQTDQSNIVESRISRATGWEEDPNISSPGQNQEIDQGRQRIVQLIQNMTGLNRGWIISDDFYNEDVAIVDADNREVVDAASSDGIIDVIIDHAREDDDGNNDDEDKDQDEDQDDTHDDDDDESNDWVEIEDLHTAESEQDDDTDSSPEFDEDAESRRDIVVGMVLGNNYRSSDLFAPREVRNHRQLDNIFAANLDDLDAEVRPNRIAPAPRDPSNRSQDRGSIPHEVRDEDGQVREYGYADHIRAVVAVGSLFEYPSDHEEDEEHGNLNEGDYDETDEDYEYVPELFDDVISSDSDEMDDNDDDEDGNNENNQEVNNYDRTLPDNHAYLGNEFQESRGREVLEENSIVTIPVINMTGQNIILFPGQTIPVTISENTLNIHYRIRAYLRSCINGLSKTIGFICDPHTDPIGTTAELRSYSQQGNDETNLIFEGRQRFKLLSEPFETAITGQVRILPEVDLGSPYPLHCRAMYGFPVKGRARNHIFGQVCKHPSWLYDKYDAKAIMAKIIGHIVDWSKVVDMKREPRDFSYWMSANLPLSNEDRKRALMFACTESRLLWLLDILDNCKDLGCSNCSQVICKKADVFPMSQSGVQNAFVNKGGFIYDTLTVRKAPGIILMPTWTTEFTWFPGYEWCFAYCNNCNQHLGWHYRAEDRKLKPRKFFGFARKNLNLLIKGSPDREVNLNQAS